MTEPNLVSLALGMSHFLQLRRVTYFAPNLEKAKAWYSKVLGTQPYFDEPFYVGFMMNGYELGLDPDSVADGPGGATVFWGVADLATSLDHLLRLGARQHTAVREVGEGVRLATVLDPFDNVIGITDNPNSKVGVP